jgi:peroxiredoxin
MRYNLATIYANISAQFIPGAQRHPEASMPAMPDATSTPTATYSAYWIFALDPAFHRLAPDQQREAKAEFLSALERLPDGVRLRGSYSLVGLREDADLMLWVLGSDLDAIQRLAVSLRHSGLGAYLTATATYVGIVTPARYDPGHLPAFMLGAAPKQFISVYPFVKTTDWYLLPYEQRRTLMAEHGLVGRRYAVAREELTPAASEHTSLATRSRGRTAVAEEAPATTGGGVLANTVDAFGLGDYEFILANEADDPAEICRMMEGLRATEVRRYTRLDTPIFLARLRAPAEALADL